MRYYPFVLVLVVLFFKTEAQSLVPPEKPTLIVNIVLDNVSDEEIDRYRHLLSKDGLLKLRNEGLTFSSAFYPYASNDRASDYASISTGASPRYHGIVSDEWYVRNREAFQSAVSGEKSALVDAPEIISGYDAKNMVATTIGDELKLSTMGKSKVYSVSMDPMASVLLAGHAADAAFWFDNTMGAWVSSDYYLKQIPDWLDFFNGQNYADFYLGQEWLLSQNILNDRTIEWRQKTFLPLDLGEFYGKDSSYSILSSTPMGQMFVADFSRELIKNEDLGADDYTDLLYVNFSSITDPRLHYGKYAIEKADMLVRLDQSIARLLDDIDDEIGLDRCLIALTSTKQVGMSVQELEDQGMPAGCFDPERGQALLNSYLMAIHGQGKWVLSLHKQQVYLNKKLIEKSHLDLDAFEEQVASFMEEFSGVKWAIPSYKLKYADFKDETFIAMQESYFPSRCGDVFLSYFPGWAEAPAEDSKAFTFSHNNAMVPMYFYGWKAIRTEVTSKVYMTGLAPTLASILNISIPNSSSKNLIFDELKKK